MRLSFLTNSAATATRRLSVACVLAFMVCGCAGKREKAVQRLQRTVDKGSSKTADCRNFQNKQIDSRGHSVIEIPFLGEIHVSKTVKEVTVNGFDNTRVTLQFSVYRDEKGRFVRAEYLKGVPIISEQSIEEKKSGMEITGEKISGFPDHAPEIQWQEILPIIAKEISVEKATKICITYVECSILDGEPLTARFLCEVYGVTYYPDAYPHPEMRAKVRFDFNSKGDMEQWDSIL